MYPNRITAVDLVKKGKIKDVINIIADNYLQYQNFLELSGSI